MSINVQPPKLLYLPSLKTFNSRARSRAIATRGVLTRECAQYDVDACGDAWHGGEIWVDGDPKILRQYPLTERIDFTLQGYFETCS